MSGLPRVTTRFDCFKKSGLMVDELVTCFVDEEEEREEGW
jgi:hypothetical protein